MKIIKLITILIIVSALNSVCARQLSFDLHRVLDIQTKNGLIVPITDIIDGYETIPSVSIKNKKLIINIFNIDTPVKDIQLNNGIILDIRPQLMLMPGGGGDIGGGGNK